MIITRILIEEINCTGRSWIKTYMYESKDYHEASVTLLKYQRSNSWWSYLFIKGEMHDTESGRTWSVDNKGHTKKDYRKETTNNFIERWR